MSSFDSTDNIYAELKDTFAQHNWVMTPQQVEEEIGSIGVQIAVFYGDIKLVDGKYHWVSEK